MGPDTATNLRIYWYRTTEVSNTSYIELYSKYSEQSIASGYNGPTVADYQKWQYMET